MGGQGEEDGALENDPAHKIFLSYGGQTVKSSGNFHSVDLRGVLRHFGHYRNAQCSGMHAKHRDLRLSVEWLAVFLHQQHLHDIRKQ